MLFGYQAADAVTMPFRGLTQDDLSLLAGTSRNEIADYETGERRITLEMQHKLTWALNITAAQFFEPPEQ